MSPSPTTMIVSTVFELVPDAGQQRNERGVDDDAAVLGVVDDVGQLLGREPDVEGVQHRAHGGNGEVRLEVALVVPAERADAVPRLDAQPGQGGGELLGPVATSVKVALRLPTFLDGDRRAVAVDLLAVAEDVSDQERGVLHGALHAPSMTGAPSPCPGRPANDRSTSWAAGAAGGPAVSSVPQGVAGPSERRRACRISTVPRTTSTSPSSHATSAMCIRLAACRWHVTDAVAAGSGTER